MPLSFIIYYTSIVCFKDCSVCNMFIDIEWEILFFLFDHFLYSNICSGSCTLNIKAVPTVWYFFLFNLLNMQFLASWILHEHHDIYFQFLQDILSVPVHLTCHHVYIQGACCKKWKLMSALLEFPIAHEWNKNTCRYIYFFFVLFLCFYQLTVSKVTFYLKSHWCKYWRLSIKLFFSKMSETTPFQLKRKISSFNTIF
jgi:hypothetical protein